MAGKTSQTPFEVAAANAAARLAAPVEERNPRSGTDVPGSGGGPGGSPPFRSSNGALLVQNLEAEEAVLGALMLSKHAFPLVADTGIQVSDFARGAHRLIFQAEIALYDRQVDVDPIAVTAQLELAGQLEAAGGKAQVYALAATVPVWKNVGTYAEIVIAQARRRGLEDATIRLLAGVRSGQVDETLRSKVLEALEPPAGAQERDRLVPGGTFILEVPAEIAPVWGEPGSVLWAQGEGTMLFGPQGVGKTTVAQQLALARCGLRDQVLGLPVAPGAGRTLYLAADRPAQAARSLARMVDAAEDRAILDERLIVHRGPPEPLLTEDPRGIVRLAVKAGADTVVVDSLKDVGRRISEDEAGSAVNLAYQYLTAAGVELLILHHPRKASADNKRPNTLDDVYGSTWLTAGLGSVIILWGQAGDLIVELYHLKQPQEPVGPWTVAHDHSRGLSTVEERLDALEVLYRAGDVGAGAGVVASLIYRTEKAERNQRERVRNWLERLVDEGKATKVAGAGDDGPQATRYYYAGPGWRPKLVE